LELAFELPEARLDLVDELVDHGVSSLGGGQAQTYGVR
jgi:hypothetical protein